MGDLKHYRVLMAIGVGSKTLAEAGATIEIDPEDPNTERLLRAKAIAGPVDAPDPEAEAEAKAKQEADEKAKQEADEKAAEEAKAAADKRREELKAKNRGDLEDAGRDAGVKGIGNLNMEALIEAIIEQEAENAKGGEE